MFHLKQHLAAGLVYPEDDYVQRYYLPTFRDGLIVKNKSEAGLHLIKLRLLSKDFISFPVEKKHSIDFLHSPHFSPYKKAKRMRLGLKKVWSRTSIYKRINGNLRREKGNKQYCNLSMSV